MVGVVQLVERQVVILNVAGSSPVTHPKVRGRFLPSGLFLSAYSLQRYCNVASRAALRDQTNINSVGLVDVQQQIGRRVRLLQVVHEVICNEGFPPQGFLAA
jgi:hypothetical protein